VLRHCCERKRHIFEMLGHHAALRADASPFLHKQDAAEKIGLHVEPIEAVTRPATGKGLTANSGAIGA
jgi:hypothetical protein